MKPKQILLGVETAKELCILAHAGQFRRDGVTLYSSHPIAVAALLETPGQKIVGLLHDLIEDTSAQLILNMDSPTSLIVFKGVEYVLSTPNAMSIYLLTKPEGVTSYMVYIKEHLIHTQWAYPRRPWIEDAAKMALKVKLADMFHNMSSGSDKQKAKYLKAMPLVLAAL